MARFDYESIGGQMQDTLSSTVTLPLGGVFLLQCALTAMNFRYQWISGDVDLSDYQWNELDAILSELTLALMVEEDFVSIPVGFILPYASEAAPDGFLLCDGDSYLRVGYPLLYAVLAPEYITDADNFTVPNLNQSFVKGTDMIDDDVGDIGGASTHRLTIDEMPAHKHRLKYELDSATTGGNSRIRNSGGVLWSDSAVEATGGGEVHNNMPPWLAMPYYIKSE